VGNNAYRRIVAEAKGLGRPPEDFATTLIFTIAKKFEFGWFVAAIAVGDGGVAVYRHGGGVDILNRVDSGDFAGQTRFLTMSRIWADGEEILGRILFDIVPEFTAIVAMSDGVSDPKFSSENAFLDAETWDQFWAGLSGEVGLTKDNARADQELLEWLNFWAVGNHDDRTIVILLP
jgi:Protein phosphatase 2C